MSSGEEQEERVINSTNGNGHVASTNGKMDVDASEDSSMMSEEDIPLVCHICSYFLCVY